MSVLGLAEAGVLKDMLVAHMRQQVVTEDFLWMKVAESYLRTLRSVLTQHASDDLDVGLDFLSQGDQ